MMSDIAIFPTTILMFKGTPRWCRMGVFYWPSVRENVMKIVPVIKSSDLPRSLHFYTDVLDFEHKWPGNEDREMANGVIDLVRDGAELQLSRHSGDGVFGSVNRVFVDDVDERYVTRAGVAPAEVQRLSRRTISPTIVTLALNRSKIRHMKAFHSGQEAKEFLISEIVAEAQRENVPLSEVERKMLYFTESGELAGC